MKDLFYILIIILISFGIVVDSSYQIAAAGCFVSAGLFAIALALSQK